MSILKRYVLREFLTPVFYCFLAFASLYVTIELFSEFDKIIPAKPPAEMILRYLGGFLAKDFQWLVTPSLLLGGLYTMWHLARHSEITAMRANGISFITITSPMLFASLFFAGLIALNSEFYAPEASRESTQIKAAEFKSYGPNLYVNVPFSNIRDRRDWQIAKFMPATSTVEDVKITFSDEKGKPNMTLEAPVGQYIDGAWWFKGREKNELNKESRDKENGPDPTKVTIKTFRTSDKTGAQVLIGQDLRPLMIMPEITETPRDFLLGIVQGGIIEDSVNMSVGDMIRYVDSRPNLAPIAHTSWRYDIANRFAAPFACVVITLFAIPAGVATGRQSVFIGVVSAILMFLIFYVLTISCGVLAKKGVIPIYAGILIPNAVFLTAGLYLFWRQR